MLSKKTFKWMHHIALFAIVFASLAPSISHALAAQQGVDSFSQEICTTNGEIITIDMVTSQKKQLLTTSLDQEEGTPSLASIIHHLNHCPFCVNPNTDHGIDASNTLIVALLEKQAQQHTISTQAALSPCFSALPPPAQAPPTVN